MAVAHRRGQDEKHRDAQRRQQSKKNLGAANAPAKETRRREGDGGKSGGKERAQEGDATGAAEAAPNRADQKSDADKAEGRQGERCQLFSVGVNV